LARALDALQRQHQLLQLQHHRPTTCQARPKHSSDSLPPSVGDDLLQLDVTAPLLQSSQESGLTHHPHSDGLTARLSAFGLELDVQLLCKVDDGSAVAFAEFRHAAALSALKLMPRCADTFFSFWKPLELLIFKFDDIGSSSWLMLNLSLRQFDREFEILIQLMVQGGELSYASRTGLTTTLVGSCGSEIFELLNFCF
jgi:hypothetical protein